MHYFVCFITLFAALISVFSFCGVQVLAAPLPNARRAVDLSQGDIETFLDSHNTVRAQYAAPPLIWSPALAEKAAFWADLCMFEHSRGLLQTDTYGENIVAATGDFPITAAVGTFLSDKDQYDPANPSYLYWTQVVWKSTTQLGCAIASCSDVLNFQPSRQTLYVCLYDPAGNVIGQAPENIQVYLI